MSAIFAPANVRVGVSAAARDDVLQAIADLGVSLGVATEAGPLVEGMIAREVQGTTGLMDGVAIPHVKSAAVTQPAVLVLRLREPVPWKTMDESDVVLAIALLIPEAEAGTTHLAILSRIARGLVRADARRELLAAESPEAIHQVLAQHLPESH